MTTTSTFFLEQKIEALAKENKELRKIYDAMVDMNLKKAVEYEAWRKEVLALRIENTKLKAEKAII